MEYGVLGRTGLRVSRIGFGVYSLTGLYGGVGEEEAIELLRYAEGLGVNFYDTADVYGNGYGEELLCKAFGERGVKRIVVATKVGYDFYSGKTPPPRRYDPEYLLRAVEKSSERLCKKPIDLVQVHNPPLEVLRSKTLWRILEMIRDEGYARAIGIALGPETDVLEHALEALSHEETQALQFVYNMLEQEPGSTIARLAAKKKVGTITRVPHAGGVLDESIRPGEEKKLRDHRVLRRSGWYNWAFRLYNEMKKVIASLPGTPGQIAIRFVLDSAPIDTVIIIAKDKTRLKEYIDSLRLPRLSPGITARLRELYLGAIHSSPEKPAKSLEKISRLRVG